MTIDESTESVAQLQTSDVSYPPGVELIPDEVSALANLNFSENAKSGLRKLVKNASFYPLFHFFSLLDGVIAPDTELSEMWMGATIESKSDEEDVEMFHDELCESYWNYNDKK